MKNTQDGLVAVALLVVVGAMFVTGGVYVYSKYKKDSADRDLIFSVRSALRAAEPSERALQISADLAWAKARLQMESNKLNELKADARAAGDLNTALRDTYLRVNEAVDNPAIQIRTPNTAVEIQISGTLDQINQILDNWQSLILAGTAPQNTKALQAAVNRDLPTVQSYLATLSSTVSGLTPTNSGLTQTQINEYKLALDAAVVEVSAATSALEVAQTQTSTPTSTQTSPQTGGETTTNTPSAIQTQQQIVDQLQAEIERLADEQAAVQIEIQNQTNTGTNTGTGTTSTTSNTTTGTTFVPPQQTSNPDGPQLIQGINPN